MSTPTPTPTRDSNPIPGGLIPDPGASALQEGDFGLDGDLRATMLAALESRWNADNPGATTLPDDDASTQSAADQAAGANQPDPATPSTAVAPTPALEDGAGVGGDAGEGAAPVDPALLPPGTPPSTSAPTPASDFDLNAYARDYFGTNLTPDQARELFGVLGGLQALTPEQRYTLDQTLAGGAPNQYPATTGQPVQPITPGPAPSSSPPANPLGLPPRPDDEYEARIYDQYIAPLAAATQAQLSDVQANIARTTQAQLDRQRAEADAQIASSASAWRAQHPILTDGEYDALTDRIIRSGTFGPLVQAHGSVAAATSAALDQFFWADPTLRQKAIANIASGRQAGDPSTSDPTSPVAQQAASDAAQRQGRAASVAGGGGNSTPRGPAPAPTDAASRKQAMIQELAAQGDF